MAEAELQQRLEEYEGLLEISVELASSLEVEKVLGVAMDRAEKLCSAETSSIWELDDDRGELFFRRRRSAIAGCRSAKASSAVWRCPATVRSSTT